MLGFIHHHGNDPLLNLSVNMHDFSERPALRAGHSALGSNNHKANATLTHVQLEKNNIGDRGAVQLADAVKALLVTVPFVSSTQSVLLVLDLFISCTDDSVPLV